MKAGGEGEVEIRVREFDASGINFVDDTRSFLWTAA